MRNDYSLTPAEWHVMECLWDKSSCTGREATDYLSRSVGWSRSTILTMLRRMQEKELISCHEENGVLTYAPLIPKEDAVLSETQSFLDRVYHGSMSMMLSAFTKKQPLTEDEIAELYAILEDAKGGDHHD